MSGQQLFSFPTVDSLINRFNTDAAFATAVNDAFTDGITAAQLRASLESAYDDLGEGVLQQLSVALEAPMSIAGIAIPAVGPQALMVAVFCQGDNLVARYKIGSGGFMDMIRTVDSVACQPAG